MNHSKVSIIILNWNGLKDTIECLESLKKITYPNYEVIVVDNGSEGNDADILEEKYKGYIRLIRNKENLGFAGGNNVGIKYALKKYKPEYVLLLNNDIKIIQEDWLGKMVEIAEANEKIGVVGCKLIYPDGRTQYIGTKICVKGLLWLDPTICDNFPEVFEVDAVLGACFLIKKKVLNIIGFFDEGFSPFQYEESDYCVRAKMAGFNVCTISSAKVVHIGSASMSKIRSNYFDFITKKNEIRFMLLNFPIKWLICHLPYEIRAFLAYCFLTKDRYKKCSFPFNIRIRKDWRNRTKAYTEAWFINLRNLREIIVKRRKRTEKVGLIDHCSWTVPRNLDMD